MKFERKEIKIESPDVLEIMGLRKRRLELEIFLEKIQSDIGVIDHEINNFSEYMTAKEIREELNQLSETSLTVKERSERGEFLRNKLKVLKEKSFAVITWEAEKGEGYHCPACSTDKKVVAMCKTRELAGKFIKDHGLSDVGQLIESENKLEMMDEMRRRWGKYTIKNLLEE